MHHVVCKRMFNAAAIRAMYFVPARSMKRSSASFSRWSTGTTCTCFESSDGIGKSGETRLTVCGLRSTWTRMWRTRAQTDTRKHSVSLRVRMATIFTCTFKKPCAL